MATQVEISLSVSYPNAIPPTPASNLNPNIDQYCSNSDGERTHLSNWGKWWGCHCSSYYRRRIESVSKSRQAFHDKIPDIGGALLRGVGILPRRRNCFGQSYWCGNWRGVHRFGLCQLSILGGYGRMQEKQRLYAQTLQKILRPMQVSICWTTRILRSLCFCSTGL